MKRSVFRFRIELRDIAPTVWREIEVPGDYSFGDLHVAIQDAMGWLDHHLHTFLSTGRGNGGGDWEIGIPIDDESLDDRTTFASSMTSATIGLHDVVLEEIIACDSESLVACTGGERA